MKASMPAGRSSRVRLVPAGASGRKTVNLSLHMGSGGFWRRFGVFGDNAMILGHVPWNSDLGRRYAKPESDFKGSPSERPLFLHLLLRFFSLTATLSRARREGHSLEKPRDVRVPLFSRVIGKTRVHWRSGRVARSDRPTSNDNPHPVTPHGSAQRRYGQQQSCSGAAHLCGRVPM